MEKIIKNVYCEKIGFGRNPPKSPLMREDLNILI